MLFSENLADHSGLRLLPEFFNYLELDTLLKPDPDLEGNLMWIHPDTICYIARYIVIKTKKNLSIVPVPVTKFSFNFSFHLIQIESMSPYLRYLYLYLDWDKDEKSRSPQSSSFVLLSCKYENIKLFFTLFLQWTRVEVCPRVRYSDCTPAP